jgi:hypothetical protein
LLAFNNTKYISSPQIKQEYGSTFQIISNNTGFAPYLSNCKGKPIMNANLCHRDELSIILFESEDEDTLRRAMQPIYISINGTKMANKLNAFMDREWEGFYNIIGRLSRFPGLIDGEKGSVYNITYSGAPAKKQRFTLTSQSKNSAMTIRIHYPSA